MIKPVNRVNRAINSEYKPANIKIIESIIDIKTLTNTNESITAIIVIKNLTELTIFNYFIVVIMPIL